MPLDRSDDQPVEREPTRLETISEIHRAVQALLAAPPTPPAAKSPPTVPDLPEVPPVPLVPAHPTALLTLADLALPTAPAAPPAPDQTLPFRPRGRPPRALLCILDDGLEDGEWVRLRGDRYVIGRGQCDVRVPDDNQMSLKHAELSRRRLAEGDRWLLTDLKSTNGTFVRVGSSPLADGQELLVGHTRLRLDAGASPALIDVLHAGQRFPLDLASVWIGRDPGCEVHLRDDPCVSPRHARLFRGARGRWRVENNKSRNGLWLRVEQITLDAACQFQLGEQRFVFRQPAG